jgi:hypothetical protein
MFRDFGQHLPTKQGFVIPAKSGNAVIDDQSNPKACGLQQPLFSADNSGDGFPPSRE